MVVVYTTMVGEPFEHGHVAFLLSCKQLGDELIVGVCGHARPASRQTVEQRSAVVAACRYVDRVVPGGPLRITRAFLDQHGIDLVVGGYDEDELEVDHAPAPAPEPPRWGDLSQARVAQMLARLDRACGALSTTTGAWRPRGAAARATTPTRVGRGAPVAGGSTA
jgi:hypothetical protein